MESVAREVVLPCDDLDATLAFFLDRLGFRVARISPADDPRVAIVVGHGLRVRLDRDATIGAVSEVAVWGDDGNPPDAPLVPSLTVSHAGDGSWHVGRAGMHYRDLVPDRQGGRIIASHIAIPDGGPVADYVHYHRVRFQMIYCARGWVRVVYEDQGEPFVLNEGDCVLQPPQIRHRVLEASPGMEVVEVGSPAVHDTFGDLDMSLPTPTVAPEREFGGQRFVRHVAADAPWVPWRAGDRHGFECRDTGIAAGTRGLAGAVVVRSTGATATRPAHHDGELLFVFVLRGETTLSTSTDGVALRASSSATIPSGTEFALTEWAPGTEVLEVTLPAR